MGKLSRAFTVQYLVVYIQCLEKLGQNDATHAVDGVGADTEVTFADSLNVG